MRNIFEVVNEKFLLASHLNRKDLIMKIINGASTSGNYIYTNTIEHSIDVMLSGTDTKSSVIMTHLQIAKSELCRIFIQEK